MELFKRYLFVVVLAGLFFSCAKHVETAHYSIGKVTKSDTASKLSVHINSRLTAAQLIGIAYKIRTDSTNLRNLKLIYLLPGNVDETTGPNSYYAALQYVKTNQFTPTDTLKDNDGTVVRLKIFGLNSIEAKRLLSLTNSQLTGKHLLGRFIDDYNHTVIIPFTDSTDKKNQLYIIELDSTAKIVSATMPVRAVEKGVEKIKVSERGDYITLKDSVLKQFSIDDFGIPYNSIKSGI